VTFEAFILGCSLTYAQAIHIMRHEKEYNIRAVACAIDRWKQDQPKPRSLKTLRDVPVDAALTKTAQ